VSILRQTLEEAKAAESSSAKAGKKPSSSSQDETASKSSKKRKRSGELVSNTKDGENGLEELLGAIFSVISFIQLSAKPDISALDDGRGAEFSAEAMRSTLRTTAEEGAKIAGLWFSLSRTLLNRADFSQLAGRTWLSHFVEIWGLHSPGTEDLMQFSLYASQDLISLLRAAKSAEGGRKDWVSVLEELVARNIMIPAKAANADNPESDMIGTLTRVSVITDSANAPLLFEIAIRSIQPHGTRRRRPEDDNWLQKVFNTLVDAMPPKRHEKNSAAIQSMLQSAITYKVGFELPILRAVTSKYALPDGTTNWALLHTLILLDANVFFIQDGEKDLLQEVLTRITTVSVDPAWIEISKQVVSDVVLPLMSESANARDLSGFIRHWHAELVEIEKLRKEKRSSSSIFSAWEDDALQTQLAKLFEPSLTLRQITRVLDFLEEEAEKAPDAVCVLVDTIAGAITREEVVDTVQLRLSSIIFDNRRSKKLDKRYRWRSWRILSRTLSWASNSRIGELAALWEEGKKPFDKFSGKSSVKGLLDFNDGVNAGLEPLEELRTACAAWDKAEEWSPLRKLAKATLLNFLKGLASDIKSLLRDLRGEKQLGEEVCGVEQNTQLRGAGWMVWSFARAVFVEYPKALE
jgi:nucleolar pre-ribosomal-associated protein 2